MSELIKLPSALSQGLVLAGLTAPSMRMALVLIAAASPATGSISIVKPYLEKSAGVRLDNAHKSLERLREATIVDAHGEPAAIFDELVYTPGEQKRLAGIVSGSISSAAREIFAANGQAGRTVQVDLDELRRLSTTPGVLLLLRLAADRANGDIRLRMDEDECAKTFGDYLSRATIERQNAVGDHFQWTALSRIFGELVEPGVKDLWGALDGFVVDAVPGVPATRGQGHAWSYIDITLRKLQPRKTLRELAMATKDHEDYQVRKRRRKAVTTD